jgi:precorrin-3B synthase
MTGAATLAVRGWCPGAARPMASGDGLLVRLRPPRGALPVAGARALADAASRFGNGHIDLTRRAGLQLRGVTQATHPALLEALSSAGLWSSDAGPRILLSPLAGIDPGELVDLRPLANALARAPALQDVPPKFTITLDGGGLLSLAGEAADIRLRAVARAGRPVIVITHSRHPGESRDPSARALEVAAWIPAFAGMTTFVEHHSDRRVSGEGFTHPPIGLVDLGAGRFAVGIAAPFGRIEAGQLALLAGRVEEAGAPDLRLSPWRALYAAVEGRACGEALVRAAASAGLIVDPGDPLLRIAACPGAPACPSASVDTRADARRLAGLVAGTVHVSGCAKGCARSEPADLVLVGTAGRYGIVRGGTARDAPVAFARPAELAALLAGEGGRG